MTLDRNWYTGLTQDRHWYTYSALDIHWYTYTGFRLNRFDETMLSQRQVLHICKNKEEKNKEKNICGLKRRVVFGEGLIYVANI